MVFSFTTQITCHLFAPLRCWFFVPFCSLFFLLRLNYTISLKWESYFLLFLDFNVRDARTEWGDKIEKRRSTKNSLSLVLVIFFSVLFCGLNPNPSAINALKHEIIWWSCLWARASGCCMHSTRVVHIYVTSKKSPLLDEQHFYLRLRQCIWEISLGFTIYIRICWCFNGFSKCDIWCSCLTTCNYFSCLVAFSLSTQRNINKFYFQFYFGEVVAHFISFWLQLRHCNSFIPISLCFLSLSITL